MPTAAANAATDQGAGAQKADSKPYVSSCGPPSKPGFAQCFAKIRATLQHDVVAQPNDPLPTSLGPEDIQDAYNLPASGEGQTVAIVDAFGYTAAEDDLAVFRDYFGLPSCTSDNGCFTKVNQDGEEGPYPPDDQGWALETALDLDAVSSACPACNILLVEGDTNGFDDLGIAVDTAVGMGAKFVSNSYGVDNEFPDQGTYDHYYDHPGVAVTVSSGDTGNVQSWPATNPNVVGIGGTTLTQDESERGWHESAWSGAGSGCSLYEEKPAYQADIDTNCDNRASADISADADPNTGLAVYDSLGFNGQTGWFQVGGTSLASPLVAAMYAVAGTPVPDTYPVTYPYANPVALNDVTEGSNGGCGNVLCTAGPGWDGPTGLGTPNGVDALTTGPHGDIEGTVTDSGTGGPLANATVATDQGQTVTTDAEGDYDLTVPTGTYDVTASLFGYASETQQDLAVGDGATVEADFALDAVPSQNVHGTVTDDSGQGWPLYAKITVDGVPGSTYTDPFTGYYGIDLPGGSTYTLHVTPQYPGYQTADVQVDLGDSGLTQNVAVPVDAGTCTAPGYGFQEIQAGPTEEFTGWEGTTPQDGWTVVDNEGNGQTWDFDNARNRTLPPNSDGDLAIVDSDNYGSGNSQDTSLVSAPYDLSGLSAPVVQFDTYYDEYPTSVADVDYSTDGGATWTNAWHQTTTSVQDHVIASIAGAAGQSSVQVRFHYTGSYGWYWLADNVSVGDRPCVSNGGGLVAGFVTDNNTGDPVNGAKVTSDDNPDQSGTTMATPDDANLGDGFYWMYSSLAGDHSFTAGKGAYVSDTESVDVAASFVTRQDFVLRAGHISMINGSIEKTEQMGGLPKSQVVRFRNDGTEPAHVELSESDGGYTPMAGGHASAKGAPLQVVKTDTSFTMHAGATKAGKPGKAGSKPMLRSVTPYDEPWVDLPDYPTNIMDNMSARSSDGMVYSVGGTEAGFGPTGASNVYDPSSQQWSSIADEPTPTQQSSMAFVGGKLVVAGGWGASTAISTVQVYDPASDSWSTAADLPAPRSAAGTAVVGGKLYVVGGCTTGACAPGATSTLVYDPGADSWSQVADYPQTVAFASCGGVNGALVCAGGMDPDTNPPTTYTATYVYEPGADSWTQSADMPLDAWAAAYTSANGQLLVSGGAINGGFAITNQGNAFSMSGTEASTGTWTALPNSNNALYRGAGACGFDKVGGSTGNFASTPFVEELPGYNECGGGGADVPWLSENKTEFDVAPGQTVKVRVTIDNSMLDQPGDYAAALAVSTDTPYSAAPVDATLHLNPPRTWGKISGTVTDAGSGSPLAGATVRVNTLGGGGAYGITLKTDADGYYQYWLDDRYNPLQLVVAMDGYVPKIRNTRIHRHENTTVNIALSATD